MGRLLTAKEACQRLGISITTLRRWEKEGKIKCVRTPGGWRRVPESEIKRLLGEPIKASPPHTSQNATTPTLVDKPVHATTEEVKLVEEAKTPRKRKIIKVKDPIERAIIGYISKEMFVSTGSLITKLEKKFDREKVLSKLKELREKGVIRYGKYTRRYSINKAKLYELYPVEEVEEKQ